MGPPTGKFRLQVKLYQFAFFTGKIAAFTAFTAGALRKTAIIFDGDFEIFPAETPVKSFAQVIAPITAGPATPDRMNGYA